MSDTHTINPINTKPSSNQWEARVKAAREVRMIDVCYKLEMQVTPIQDDRWYCECPLHKDEGRNLKISPHKGRSGLWYCFVCEKGGDPISLYMEVTSKTFPQVVREFSHGK